MLHRSLTSKQLTGQLADAHSTRLGEPSDIASAIAYLMSADAEWVNGQVLVVDGGRYFTDFRRQ